MESIIILVISAVVIALVVANNIKISKELKEKQDKYDEMYYPNRNYKCLGSEFYGRPRREKLLYYYDSFPDSEKDKLYEYAERLQREIDRKKYSN